MTTYQSRMMNIARQGAGRVDVFDDSFNNGHRIGHRDARHAAADIAVEADAEIARLQAQVTESQRQSDALLARGLDYCDKIEALQAQVDGLRSGLDVWSATAGRAQARATELQAQVDALAVALERAKRTMADYGQCDNDNWPCFQAVCAALVAVGR